MILLLKILCALALALASGLVFLAVLKMDAEEWEPDDQMSEEWLRGQR